MRRLWACAAAERGAMRSFGFFCQSVVAKSSPSLSQEILLARPFFSPGWWEICCPCRRLWILKHRPCFRAWHGPSCFGGENSLYCNHRGKPFPVCAALRSETEKERPSWAYQKQIWRCFYQTIFDKDRHENAIHLRF